MCVKSHLTSGTPVRSEISVTYSVGNRGQNVCRVFSETALFESYGVICLPVTSYEVLHHSLLRVLKRLNNRLNTIRNTTGCKAASSLVSIFPLKSSIYFPLNVIIVRFNSAYAFKTDSLSRVR